MGDAVKIVVTDLDGTLWDNNLVVHRRTLTAIGELAERGIPLLAATARRAGGARRLLANSGLHLPAVLLDGALVRDQAWRTLSAATFEPRVAGAVLAAFATHGVEPCVSVVADDDVDARLGDRPATHPAHLEYLRDWAIHADLHAVVATEPVQSFVVCGRPNALLEPIARSVAPLAAVNLSWDPMYDGSTITVGPPDVHKWRGVVAYCDAHGIDPGRVLAVGDGVNDIEMLRAARVACVVRSADHRVTAHADHLVGEPGDGGWADILDHLDDA